MNQISNPGQQPGQHSAQPVAPHQQNIRFAPVPYPAAQQYHGGYDPRQQQQNYQHNVVYNHATLTLPQNSQIATSTNSNGITLVDVAAPPPSYGYDQNMVQQMNQYQYAAAMQQFVQQQHQYQPHVIPQQPPPKPIVPREKKILTFVDPSNNSAVDLPKTAQKSDVSTASSPFEPVKQDTKPHTPVNEVKDAPPSETTEDINSAFSRAVTNRAVSAKSVPSKPQEEEHTATPVTQFVSTAPSFIPGGTSFTPPVTSFTPTTASFNPAAAVPFVPGNFTAPDLIKETAPTSKEQTPTFELPKKAEQSPTPEQKVAPAIVLEEPQAETSGIEEGTPETPQKYDRASLMHEYERKLDEFVKSPEILEELSIKVYNRKLMQLLREIIRDFNTVPCPLSEQELKRIGIDRTTMPQPANVSHKSKYQGGRGDMFNPAWQPNAQPMNVRRPYNARGSKNNDGQNKNNDRKSHNKQPYNPRPSIQRQKFTTMTRDPNAWKPDVMNSGNAVDPASVEARIAKTRKDVRGLLNKITPTTAADLSVEMINKCVWREEDTLPTVVELIFIKAVEEPTFVGLYSDLCSSLHKAEQNMEKESFKRLFHGAIIRKCQSSFEITALSQFQETISKIKKEIQEEEESDEKDDKKLADLNERLEELNVKEKRRMLGTIKFISHLFRIGLLNYKIIENCIVILIRNAEQSGSELMTEYAVDLMKHVGPYIVQRKEDTSKLDGYVTYLDKFKSSVSNRVKFMIIDLTELRDKKWVKKSEGPKTKDEVKAEVQKEEEKNEIDRKVYEQAAAADQHRKRSNVVDNKQRQTYQSRPSVDKKDRLNAAAAASASASGSALKKDTSLLKIDQQRLGSTKKWGNPNTNTTSSTPSQNNKPARVIARQSVDARHNTSDARKSAVHKDSKPAAAQASKVIDSRSASITPPPADPSSSRSQNNTPTVTPEDQFNKAAFKTGFKERLQSFLDGTDVDEIAKSLIEFSNELNNPVIFFEQMFSYCCEHLKKVEQNERHAVSKLVVKCYQDPILKNAFSAAFKKYCKYLVEDDIEGDVPHLQTTLPEFVARMMATENSVPSSELVEGFKEFHDNENYMFARTLVEFGRILSKRNEDVTALGWIFEEFSNADPHYKSDEMQQILEKQPVEYDENHKNLKELIDTVKI